MVDPNSYLAMSILCVLSSVKRQSRGRLKTAKPIIGDNTSSNGSVNNDKAARAILQYRNTPIPELGLSPSKLLFHRQLRDAIPANPIQLYSLHKEWIVSALEGENAFASKYQAIESNYNSKARTSAPLTVQTRVRLQDKGNWRKTGTVMETLPHKQCRIRMDGSGRVTLRNLRFLKPASTLEPFNIMPCPMIPPPGNCDTRTPSNGPGESSASEGEERPTVEPKANSTPENTVQIGNHTPNRDTGVPTPLGNSKTKRRPTALREISKYNNPGLKDIIDGQVESCLRSGHQ